MYCIGGDRFAGQEVDSSFDATLVNNAWAVVLIANVRFSVMGFHSVDDNFQGFVISH